MDLIYFQNLIATQMVMWSAYYKGKAPAFTLSCSLKLVKMRSIIVPLSHVGKKRN